MSVTPTRIQNGPATADSTPVGTPIGGDLAQALLSGVPMTFRPGNPTAGVLHVEIYETTREAEERMRLSRAFVEAARVVTEIREVWFIHDGHDTLVTVITAKPDLENELRIEALFRSLFRLGADVHDALLDVFSEPEGVPESARNGQQLFP